MEHVASLERGARLVDRPELKPLEKYAGERLTSVSYVSKAMMAQVGTTKEDIDQLKAEVMKLATGFELTADQRARIARDLDEMARDVKKLIPEPGAMLSFAFLTRRGQESYTYDWSESLSADSSKPLTILNHAGGSPILLLAGRTRYQPEHYQLLVKWLKKGSGYFEEFGVPMLDEKGKDMYKLFTRIGHPLLERVDRATGMMLLPALADGQSALVLDARLSSKQWHKAMPEADTPLPLPELAFVFSVSDADLLRKAMKEYHAIANDAIAKIRELGVGEIPAGFKIPEPNTRELRNGTAYYYPLPKDWGLDERLVPTAGLSDRMLALTLSHDHADRLLTRTPLNVQGGPLGDLERPRSGAVYLNVPAFLDAAKPWVAYLFKVVEGEEEHLKQVLVVMDVLKVLRSYASSTYTEGGATVTHSEAVIEDVK
jgi:hypothetical protein